MKRFFSVFLGSMAAIWFSVIIGGILLLFTFAAIGISKFNSDGIKVQRHSVLKIDLSGEVEERETPVGLMDRLANEGLSMISLEKLIAAIDKASADDDIEGIVIDCHGLSVGSAQAQAIREALQAFKAKGKWIYSYSDNYEQIDYFIASVADSMFINPIGMVNIHGLSAMNIYFKDLLDKLGVSVQVVKVGTYKSAVEPFILNESSEANRKQQEHYLNSFWGEISGAIAAARGVSVERVNDWANGFVFADPTDSYVKNQMVDKELYRHEFEEFIVKESGLEKDDSPRFIGIDDYYVAKGLGALKNGGKQIAILYAVGDITESGNDGIASDRLVPQILELAKNEDIDGLILRINSGGGSAFASEQIWEALQQFKKLTGKPFYVSMSDVAASGGYYIACGADKIYAQPLTITGSIGIFGLVPDASKLLNDKIGIHTSTVSTNEGQFPGFVNPMTPAQRNAMQSYVDRGYELFVSRVAKGRGMEVDSVKAIGEGRVWDGLTASKIGLVDKLGSLQTAISDMAFELGASKDYYTVSYPPVTMEWWEIMLEKSLSSKIGGGNFGKYVEIYEGLQAIKEWDPLQARMDMVVIK